MSAHILKGTKQEIADRLARLPGDVYEAIVFIDETSPSQAGPRAGQATDLFAEMQPYMVDVPDLDDSRESIYTPANGE